MLLISHSHVQPSSPWSNGDLQLCIVHQDSPRRSSAIVASQSFGSSQLQFVLLLCVCKQKKKTRDINDKHGIFTIQRKVLSILDHINSYVWKMETERRLRRLTGSGFRHEHVLHSYFLFSLYLFFNLFFSNLKLLQCLLLFAVSMRVCALWKLANEGERERSINYCKERLRTEKQSLKVNEEDED